MKVDIKEIQALLARKKEINSIPLAQIELYDGDVKIEIDPAVRKIFSYTGLSNLDFFKEGIYLEKITEEDKAIIKWVENK